MAIRPTGGRTPGQAKRSAFCHRPQVAANKKVKEGQNEGQFGVVPVASCGGIHVRHPLARAVGHPSARSALILVLLGVGCSLAFFASPFVPEAWFMGLAILSVAGPMLFTVLLLLWWLIRGSPSFLMRLGAVLVGALVVLTAMFLSHPSVWPPLIYRGVPVTVGLLAHVCRPVLVVAACPAQREPGPSCGDEPGALGAGPVQWRVERFPAQFLLALVPDLWGTGRRF